MNKDCFSRLAKYSSPSIGTSRSLNTQAINQYGDIFVLTNEPSQAIVFSNIRTVSEQGDVSVLPLDISQEKFHSYNFNSIEFNEVGNCLLLWNSSIAAVIAIPKQATLDGMISIHNLEINDSNKGKLCCHFQLLAPDFLSDRTVISKVSYHSLSPYHVLILLAEGPLLVVDLIRDVSQSISLPIDKKFISFTCGPHSMDWLKFTVLLLTSESEIYALCPVIPFGIDISSNQVEELWIWVNDQYQSGVSEPYLSEVENYLKSVFPKLSNPRYVGNDTSFTNDLSPVKQPFVENGNNMSMSPLPGNNNSSRKEVRAAVESLTRKIIAQGPIVIERGNSTQSSTIYDIACIRSEASDASNAPIIMLTYLNGDLEICILCATEETPLSFINPIWSDLPRSARLFDVPSLVVGDRVSVSTISPNAAVSLVNNRWFVIADPVHPHFVHVYGQQDGAACVFTVVSKWLESAINGNCEQEPLSALVVPVFNSTSSSSLSSVNVVCDPLVGHIVTFRTSRNDNSGCSIGSLNIPVHIKLFELEHATNSLQSKLSLGSNGCEGEPESKSNSSSDDRRVYAQDVLNEEGVAALRKVIAKIPIPEKDLMPSTNEKQSVQDLSTAKQYIYDSIMIPFEELSQRLLFRMETISKTLGLQQELLDDSSSATKFSFKSKLDLLANNHEELSKRLVTLQQVHEEQKALADDIYYRMSKRLFKTSDADRQYKKELQDWQDELESINSKVEKVKRAYVASTLLQNHKIDESDGISEAARDESKVPGTSANKIDLFSPMNERSRGLFRPQRETSNYNQDEISRIFQSPNDSSVNISRLQDSNSTSTPLTTVATPLSINNLKPNIRSPYKSSLVHKSKSNITTPLVKLSDM